MGKIAFLEFAKRTKCAESIFFYFEVEDYKQIPNSDYKEIRGRKIIYRYIKDGASMRVNIGNELVNRVIDQFKKEQEHAFDAAQEEVFSLMTKDSYLRFLNSPEMVELRCSVGDDLATPPELQNVIKR